MITNYNDLLRSAHEIAKRKGANTNWEAFENNLRWELLCEAGLADSGDNEQSVLRATCTAKTYQIYPT